MRPISAYGGLQQAMPLQENKTMSTNPLRRPLPIAAPSAPPPVFAISSSYEPRSAPAEAYVRERRRHSWVAPTGMALALLLIYGVLALLLYRRRPLG
jgi:hypothetical protein